MTHSLEDLDALRGYTPREVCEELYHLAAAVPAGEAIVELGTYRGASACWLAAGAQSGEGAHVWTVDPHDLPGERHPTGIYAGRTDYTVPEIREHAAAQIASVGLTEQVTMVRGFSTEVATTWTGPRVGLLYIDGDHRQHAARRDFRSWQPHLSRGAVIAWDDHADSHPGVPRAVAALVERGVITEPDVRGRLAITRLAPRRALGGTTR